MGAGVCEPKGMRIAGAYVLLALLAAQPLIVCAASYNVGPPDPVGERVYTSVQLGRVAVPIAILAGGFCVAWLVAKARRHTRKLAPNNGESHAG